MGRCQIYLIQDMGWWQIRDSGELIIVVIFHKEISNLVLIECALYYTFSLLDGINWWCLWLLMDCGLDQQIY